MIAITGATGFVGSEIVRQARVRNWPVRLVQRGELGDPAPLAGAACVIHLIGIIVERGANTFDHVHTGLTQQVVDAAQQAGVRRFIHMSALGTRPLARSRYHQTKWAAEEMVRQSGLAWTIFRPSVIYGPGDQSTTVLAKVIRRLPVVPVLGDGQSRVQPVAVAVVARAFLEAVEHEAAVGKTYDLCGPAAMTWNELYDELLKMQGLRRAKLHLPLWLARLQAVVLERLPNPPFTRDQLIMTQEDNIGDPEPASREFHLEQPVFAEGIALYLARRKKAKPGNP